MRPNKLRQPIIDVAARLFYEQGYNLTGINQIIKETAMVKGSFYNNFKSKEELLVAYIDHYTDEWLRLAVIRLHTVSDPQKKLLALIDYRIETQESKGCGGCPLVKVNDEILRSDQKINGKIVDNKNRIKDFLNEIVKATTHNAVLTDQAFSNMVYLLLEGGLVGSSVYRNTSDLKDAKEIVAQLLK